jgi:undecaprenyl-diphosphatase
VAAAAVLIVLLVGASRVYLGVHYLTDVVAGWILGLAWLLVCVLALTIREARRANR